MSEEEKKRKLQIGLGNDVLMTNCCVPIIFVINKSDEPYPKYEDRTEFILKHVRKTAINYGGTVIYTSTKSNFNITVLSDYIFHSLFNYDLVYRPNMIDKNSFFIPAGYDRLSILKSSDTQSDLDYEFTDIIKEEKEDEEMIEDEILCENMSDFLKKVKERVYKSRKSMLRDDLKIGKSLLSGHGEKHKKKETTDHHKDKDKEKEKDKLKEKISAAEKTNKFQKFMEKRDSKPIEGDKEKPKISKEERQRITKESLLQKLKLNKNKK